MTFSVALIAELLLMGFAVTLTAYVLPFSRLRNLSTGIGVGILIALINGLTLWTLHKMGISINPGSLTLIGFLVNVMAVFAVDTMIKGFYIRHLAGALVFALLVSIAHLGIVEIVQSVV